jgi:5-methylthioadenosine/S-adenosylhomocysteine deaminase
VEIADGAGAEVEIAVCAEGRIVLPGLVNAHDQLDVSLLPPLGAPPHRDFYDWVRVAAEQVGRDHVRPAVEVELPDRLYLGGLRNLFAGVTATVHHGPDHRSLGSPSFPVRVQRRYGFAHSPGLTPDLRKRYRTSDRRIPWFVRAAAGEADAALQEIRKLHEAHVLRQNTVIVGGSALEAAEIGEIAAARASVVWCPEVERRLYGATAPIPGLLSAGVPVGLGSDGCPAGSRDLLSALAAARGTGMLDDRALIHLATVGSGQVARLPVGGTAAGDVADLIVVDSLEELLRARRTAIALVVVNGRRVLGAPELMAGDPGSASIWIDGVERRVGSPLARRTRALVGRALGSSGPLWLQGVRVA